MSVVSNIISRTKAKFKNTKIHRKVKLISSDKIVIGKKTVIERDATLKGGITKDTELKIGDVVCIRQDAYISASKSNVIISDCCYIANKAWIGGGGNITIGDNSMVGMNVVIISSNHNYNNITRPYYKGKEFDEDIVIGKNVWIGANSVILLGVTIGNNSVVAAGSVVKEDVPDNVIVAGSPAKIKKTIDRNNNILEETK